MGSRSQTRSAARERKRSRPTNAGNACKPDGATTRHDEYAWCRFARIRPALSRRSFWRWNSWLLLTSGFDFFLWSSPDFGRFRLLQFLSIENAMEENSRDAQ